MYATMAVWETDPALAAESELRADFAHVWQAADKIVYSTTLDAASTAKSRLERRFDPDSIRRMKEAASRDLTVAGPNLAAHAFRARLIDECHLFIDPVVVGRGKPSLPQRPARHARVARRAPVRQRRCVRPPSHPDLSTHTRATRPPRVVLPADEHDRWRGLGCRHGPEPVERAGRESRPPPAVRRETERRQCGFGVRVGREAFIDDGGGRPRSVAPSLTRATP
jgi:RibD C-terminal domain